MTAVPETEEAPAPARPGLLPRTPIVALRVLQFAIDLGIVGLLTLLPMSVMLVLPRNPDGSLGNMLITIPVMLGLLVVAIVISWWYWTRLPLRRGGSTLAMGWLGLRVIRVDGGEATGSQLSLRWLLLAVDAMFFGAVGLAAMLLTPRDQRIGDSLADTVVIRESVGAPGETPAVN